MQIVVLNVVGSSPTCHPSIAKRPRAFPGRFFYAFAPAGVPVCAGFPCTKIAQKLCDSCAIVVR